MASIKALVDKLDVDDIGVQLLKSCMTNITAKKTCSKVTFETDALTPSDVFNDSKQALILWVDTDKFNEALAACKKEDSDNGS